MEEIKSQVIEVDNKLKTDREDCLKEIVPILEKYNLTFSGKLFVFGNGMIAQAVLVRPEKEKEKKN